MAGGWGKRPWYQIDQCVDYLRSHSRMRDECLKNCTHEKSWKFVQGQHAIDGRRKHLK